MSHIERIEGIASRVYELCAPAARVALHSRHTVIDRTWTRLAAMSRQAGTEPAAILSKVADRALHDFEVVDNGSADDGTATAADPMDATVGGVYRLPPDTGWPAGFSSADKIDGDVGNLLDDSISEPFGGRINEHPSTGGLLLNATPAERARVQASQRITGGQESYAPTRPLAFLPPTK